MGRGLTHWALRTPSKSEKLYIMATAKVRAVTKPMTVVDMSAAGTATPGLAHSSARWMAPSRPE